MGNRLSKIYTRTGDDGTTGLGDGNRVPKDFLRVETYGTVDELNSQLGLLMAHEIPPNLSETFNEIQHLLFDLGGELCMPGYVFIKSENVAWLEQELDKLNDGLPTLKEFILPGGNLAAASCHICRTVCRRAERLMVSLAREENVEPFALAFINRLSDFLFVAARVLARANGAEVLWRGRGQE
jgi:cob(I)alamin adenosyltransferase